MAINEKPDMSILWAEEGARVTPTEAKIKEGWVVEPPPHQWENWSQFRQESAIAHIFQRGVPQWDNKTHYNAGNIASYVLGSDGKIYKSILHSGGDGGAPKDPTDPLNNTFWKVAFTSSDEMIEQARITGLIDALADKVSISDQVDGLDTKLGKNNNLNDLGNVFLARQSLGLKTGAVAEVVGYEGQSTADVMSQKAVTDFLVERTGQASKTQFGITRYATDSESVNRNKEFVAIDPKTLFRVVDNYLSVEIKAPKNLTPTSQQLSVERTPTLTGSVYMPLYSPNTRATREFQVTTVMDATFTTPLYEGSENSDSHTLLSQLPIATEVIWRIRDISINGDESEWSTPTSFSTGSEAIAAPVILSPLNNATDVKETPTLQSSVFAVTGGTDTFDGLVFEVKNFSGDIIHTSPKIMDYSYQLPAGILQTGENIYTVRVRHYGLVLNASPWSSPNTFTTDNVFIGTPSILYPAYDAVDIPEQPVIQSSVFTVSGGSDIFQGAIFEVKNNLGTVVHTSPKVVALEYALPAGVLEEGGKVYTVRVKHFGQDRGESAWSAAVRFTTDAQFLPSEAGAPFGGGYFVAMYTHPRFGVCALVDGGIATESPTVLQWKTTQTSTAGTDSLTDGEANTAAMTTPSLKSVHPAAAYMVDLSVSGETDWCLPAKNQLELCYRYLKPFTQANSTGSGANTAAIPATPNYSANVPAQTNVVNYKQGGLDAYQENHYWSSSQISSSTSWFQFFYNGTQSSTSKSTARPCRGVRSVAV